MITLEISCMWESQVCTSTYGVTTIVFPHGTYYSPWDILDAYTSVFGLTYTIDTDGYVAISGLGATWTIDLGSTDIRDLLGSPTQVITQDTAIGPVQGFFRCAERQRYGFNELRSRQDGGGHDGLTMQADEEIVTSRLTLAIHTRADSATLADQLAAYYAACAEWAYNRIAIRRNGVNSIKGWLPSNWECRPEWRDAETITCDLEVISWPG